jgi:hypothetical protein
MKNDGNTGIAETPVIDPAAELAAVSNRLASLETLSVSEAAQHVKGHRPAATIEAELAEAKATLAADVRERDRQYAKVQKAKKLRDVAAKLAEGQYKAAGLEFVRAEWESEQEPLPAIDATWHRAFHKQHYKVASLEAELVALADALGPGAFA